MIMKRKSKFSFHAYMEQRYHSFITEDVFSGLADSVKRGGANNELMWEQRNFRYIGESKTVYRSSGWWKS
jgi:hypothetical protein